MTCDSLLFSILLFILMTPRGIDWCSSQEVWMATGNGPLEHIGSKYRSSRFVGLDWPSRGQLPGSNTMGGCLVSLAYGSKQCSKSQSFVGIVSGRVCCFDRWWRLIGKQAGDVQFPDSRPANGVNHTLLSSRCCKDLMPSIWWLPWAL